jgi:hypothetical protein
VVDEPRELRPALRDVGDQARRRADEALQQRRVDVDLLEQSVRGRQRRVEVRPARARLGAAARIDVVLPADEAAQGLARLRVEGVEELVEIDRGRRLALADDAVRRDRRGVVAGWELEVDVAVRDPGERGEPDRRVGALPQGRGIAVHLRLDPRLAVGRELDVLDAAHGLAADLDLVALDDLGGVLEQEVVGLAPAA